MGPVALRVVALGEQLADELRSRIVRGRIPPGTHLVEDSVASDYNVSRGPVRDALRTLSAEGLLEPRRRGYYVRPFRQHDIDELYEIRGAAEHLAGRLAMERAERADWAGAEQYLDEMRQHALEVRDEHRYAVADLAFHTEFYRNSRSARLLNLWRQYQPIFATLLDITNRQDPDLGPSYHDHVVLLEHMINRDAEGFARTLDDHLAGSRRRLSRAITQPG